MRSTAQASSATAELRSHAEDCSWLPDVNPAHVDLINRLVGVRVAFRLSLPPAELAFEVADGTALPNNPIEIAFLIGTAPGRWLMPAATLDGLSAALGVQGDVSALTALQRNILLEEALAPSLEALETHLGEPLRLGPPETVEDYPIKLAWFVYGGDFPLPAELHLSVAAASKIGTSLGTRRRFPTDFTGSLVQRLQIRAGTQQLSLAELKTLRPGDVVQVERSGTHDAFVTLGNHLVAALDRRDDGFVFASGWKPFTTSWEFSAMTQETPSSEELEPLADLPIELVFEVGRAEFPLNEIAAMSEGTVLHANPSLASPVNILANGRLIGKGELIRIGEGLGVRVVRLSTDG
ncbi:type III secretion system cytoplasmic ring protein SctQ [Ciceribacter thiooxidans]|uniref:Type III secretion system cytoplasmic ring protein SctQ n=1 Tax=Ciceribacter thiooxidans TaxID=1969821 RepID=A0ABV7I7L2_9HYPH|nr:type III secretion system cytoplasmic ring protein SctQ [Ciceribacter thiooxidans]